MNLIFKVTKSKYAKLTTCVFTSCVVVLLLLGFLFPTKNAHAFIFGGKVTSSIPCLCSGTYLLTISAPMGGVFVYDPKTPQRFLSFNLGLLSGMWALGFYTPVGICRQPAWPDCTFVPNLGTISPIVGSSPVF